MSRRESTAEFRTVLTTGVTGFIGTSLSEHLQGSGWAVRGLSRQPKTKKTSIDTLTVESLGVLSATHPAFIDVDTVVHLAGCAHAAGMSRTEKETVFAADMEGTTQLATAAAQAGVRRFIFVSTAKVLGEESAIDQAFMHESLPAPADEYARYKLAAEDAVRDCAEAHGMEWVVVRPVLVYGEGVKGNLAALLRWLEAGYPLPFGGLKNSRSLIALHDLNDLLTRCISSPQVVGERLLASGDDALSTPKICASLAEGLGRPARIVQLPDAFWRYSRALPFMAGKVRRLAGSFLVDNSRTKALTGWQPQTANREGLVALGRFCKNDK